MANYTPSELAEIEERVACKRCVTFPGHEETDEVWEAGDYHLFVTLDGGPAIIVECEDHLLKTMRDVAR